MANQPIVCSTKQLQEITNRVAYGHRRISGPRFSPPENNYCYLYSSVLKYSPPYSKTCHKIYQNQNHFFYRCQYAVNSLGLYNFVKWILRGLVNWGAYNRTKKEFQNKLRNSADQNIFWIHSLWKLQNVIKIEFISIQARGGLISELGGGGGGGIPDVFLAYRLMGLCLHGGF